MKIAAIAPLLAGVAAGALFTWLVLAEGGQRSERAAAAPETTSRAALRPPHGAAVASAARPAPARASAEKAEPEPVRREPERRFSDADLSSWMDAALDSGYADRAASGVAAEQVEASLQELPGVSLTDLQCGDAFCRASLRREPGVEVDVSRLFGMPPLAFSGGGFTADEPDGTTRIYFARAGQSVDALRSEARRGLGL